MVFSDIWEKIICHWSNEGDKWEDNVIQLVWLYHRMDVEEIMLETTIRRRGMFDVLLGGLDFSDRQ